jgi:hypothetical protein
MFGFFRFRRQVLCRLAELRHLIIEGRFAMAADFQTLLDAVNTATNNVATRVTALQAQLADALSRGAPPTQAQLDELQALADHLNAIGAQPSNPIPDVPQPESVSPALRASRSTTPMPSGVKAPASSPTDKDPKPAA